MKLSSCFKHIPEEVRSLFFIKILTTYSFAVMYSSLVLYMTKDIGVSSIEATGVVGVFISLNFILHFLGGYAGGKVVSNNMLLAFGMVMELFGVLVLPYSLFVGLGIFLTGSGLYATSINAIMIQRYGPDDPNREVASFWIYSAMNIGFFGGHIISGIFHLQNSYSSLFLSSIVASIIALIMIFYNWDSLSDRNTDLSFYSDRVRRKRMTSALLSVPLLTCGVISLLIYHSGSSRLIMLMGIVIFVSTLLLAAKQPRKNERNKVYAFSILTFSALAFWALFFIGPMGMTIFIKQHVDSNFIGFSIPPQWFNNINTGIIVIFGPILAQWFKKKRTEGMDLSFPLLFSAALIFIGTAYAILPLSISLSAGKGMISMWWVVIAYVLLTLGELFLAPVGVAMIGKLAPDGKQGLLLGIWSMISGVASIISKFLSQLMVVPGERSSIYNFSHMFNNIGWFAIAFGILLLICTPFIKRLIDDDRSSSVNEDAVVLS